MLGTPPHGSNRHGLEEGYKERLCNGIVSSPANLRNHLAKFSGSKQVEDMLDGVICLVVGSFIPLLNGRRKLQIWAGDEAASFQFWLFRRICGI